MPEAVVVVVLKERLQAKERQEASDRQEKGKWGNLPIRKRWDGICCFQAPKNEMQVGVGCQLAMLAGVGSKTAARQIAKPAKPAKPQLWRGCVWLQQKLGQPHSTRLPRDLGCKVQGPVVEAQACVFCKFTVLPPANMRDRLAKRWRAWRTGPHKPSQRPIAGPGTGPGPQ